MGGCIKNASSLPFTKLSSCFLFFLITHVRYCYLLTWLFLTHCCGKIIGIFNFCIVKFCNNVSSLQSCFCSSTFFGHLIYFYTFIHFFCYYTQHGCVLIKVKPKSILGTIPGKGIITMKTRSCYCI